MTEPRGRGSVTRAALTDAARTIFLRSGYEAAGITEIVTLADSSVGSLYHHFDGKSDLWLAVYRTHQRTMQRLVADAVEGAGDQDGFELFMIGARAYVDGCWEHRTLVRLFESGDHPPGYGQERRRQLKSWTTWNHASLQSRRTPLSHTLVLALTALGRTAGFEVADHDTRDGAGVLRDEFLTIMRRLYPG